MSALGDTVGNFRSLGAAAARLVADVLDGPELCGDEVPQWYRDGHERDMRQANETIEQLKRQLSQPVACPERHYPKWLTDALDAAFDAIADVAGLGLTGEQIVWYGDPKRTGNYGFQAFTDEETRRAEGLQRAQTPGEVSGALSPDPPPSLGDLTMRDFAHATATACGVDPTLVHARLDQVETEVLRRQPDSELLVQAADAVERSARTTPRVLEINDLLNLADALRDRSAQLAAVEAEPECPRSAYYCGDCGVLNLVPYLSVSHDDLAAHITAARLDWAPTEPTTLTLDDALASSLLADFYITKK